MIYEDTPPTYALAAAVFTYDLESPPTVLAIDVADRPPTASGNAVVISVHRLPPATNGSFSFRSLHALLDDKGRNIFDAHRAATNMELHQRLNAGEITPLFYHRRLARMTQEQLAERAGSRQAYLSQVEKGKRPLTWKQAVKFAHVLGVAPAQLMKKD